MTSKKKEPAPEQEVKEEAAEGAGPAEETGPEVAGGQQGGAEPEQKEPSKEEAAQPPQEEEELQTRYLRLMADFQNYKRRVEKEKSDVYAYANEKLVTELLNVIDNFDRALGSGDAWSDKGMLEGMGMILKQLRDVLEKSGVQEIKAEGEDFDPAFHHAVLTESGGEYESGKVTAVLQKGYMLNSRVVRPAMVKVAE
ncbi:MAG: nucleotide exchange factor GrpE [Bacillota bacterium]|nr:nucleotide exchange factor GrpE [Bacillota bacterium]